MTQEVATTTKFYTYRQNNSGGSFYGPRVVIVEAYSASEANSLAVLYTDVYFDGCEKGIDCSCCGDRWSESWWNDDGFDEPGIYESGNLSQDWIAFPGDILILYYDGSMVTIKHNKDVD